MRDLGMFLAASCALVWLVLPHADGQELANLNRPYDPLVVRGATLDAFAGVPLQQIVVCAYRADEGRWEIIPFQVDERRAIIDPWDPVNIRLSYFTPDDQLIDADDELVLLCRDLGDRAPVSSVPDLPGVQDHVRIELQVEDPLDSGRAWAYVFQVLGQPPRIPAPYQLTYDPQNKVVSSLVYRVRLGEKTGLLEDVSILPPYGSGIDFFDTQKIRMVGLVTAFNLTVPFGRDWNPYAANERDNLFVYPDSLRTTPPAPRVRLIRQAIQAVQFGSLVFHDGRFPVEAKFYPFFGRVTGGADLATLGDLADVEIDLLRQSWDFNANATGMRLFTRYNSNVLIDGIPDSVDPRIDLPVREWVMVTGEQGTFFAYFAVQDTVGTVRTLYYRDDHNGGQSDGTVVEGGDTGYDGASYGDVGVLAKGRVGRPNLRLDFAAYFLPANQPREVGEWLNACVQTPPRVVPTVQQMSGLTGSESWGTLPTRVQLLPGYPNPFNSSVRLSVALPGRSKAQLRVFDASGRLVRIVFDGTLPAGWHVFQWDGRTDRGRRAASGVYFIELRTESDVCTACVSLVR